MSSFVCFSICENYCTLSAVELLNGNGVSETDPYPEQILHTQNIRLKAKEAQIKSREPKFPAWGPLILSRI